jgi:hypothetical protein
MTATTLADRIAAALELLNAEAGADPSIVYYAITLAPGTLEAVLHALAGHPPLWADFQMLLPSPDAADALRGRLVRLAREIGEVDEANEMLEVSQDVDVPVGMRKRIAHDLQMNKRALWSLRLCPPFGELAERINQAADGPVLDGLTLQRWPTSRASTWSCWPRWDCKESSAVWANLTRFQEPSCLLCITVHKL